jgi:acyl carrier protein
MERTQENDFRQGTIRKAKRIPGKMSNQNQQQQAYIMEGVISEIAEAMNKNRKDISPETFLTSDLGAESIDLVDLTFRIEKRFDLPIPQGELFEGSNPHSERMRVQDVANYIAQRLNT